MQSASTGDIGVVDYGLGNTCSVAKALCRLGCRVCLSDSAERLRSCKALILPGVGAFAQGMSNLNSSGLRAVLDELVLRERKPILGICLGMQMLAESSTENGNHAGLGWIPGEVVRFSQSFDLPVPHVGWNEVCSTQENGIFKRVPEGSCFYFDHSYHLKCPSEWVCGQATYGLPFNAAVQRDNICGVQFHPEKSQTAGLRLLKGFLSLVMTNDA